MKPQDNPGKQAGVGRLTDSIADASCADGSIQRTNKVPVAMDVPIDLVAHARIVQRRVAKVNPDDLGQTPVTGFDGDLHSILIGADRPI